VQSLLKKNTKKIAFFLPSSAVIAEEKYKKIRFLLASKTKQYNKSREYK